MTDESALAAFPGAKGFMEVTDPSKPLGAFGVVVDKDGTAWAFDSDRPRAISPEELKSLGARPCKPSDAVELIPADLLPDSKLLRTVSTGRFDAAREDRIVVCRTCGQKNRLPNQPSIARCGKCKGPLRQISTPVRVLRVIGYVWLGLLGAVVALSGVVILLTEGIAQFWYIFSPFNFWNWGLIFILSLPAIGLFALEKRVNGRVIAERPSEEGKTRRIWMLLLTLAVVSFSAALIVRVVGVRNANQRLAPAILKVELDPSDALAWSQLGDAYFKEGRLSKSEYAYKKAIKLPVGSYGTLTHLGRLYERQGRFNEALVCYEKEQSFELAGDMYARLGRTSDAARAYRRTIESLRKASNAKNASYYDFEHLGTVFEKLHDKESAQQAYVDGLRLGTGDAVWRNELQKNSQRSIPRLPRFQGPSRNEQRRRTEGSGTVWFSSEYSNV